MDDGFVIILAIIVFSVFRNFIREAKKKGEQPGPGSLDASAEHDEAQDRALDALRQWEAKQQSLRAGGGDMAPSRTQQPVVQRRARPFELAGSQGAEQTRREAYDAIRDLLAGKKQRPPPPVRTLPGPSQVPAPSRSAAPTRIRERSLTLQPRPRIQSTMRRLDEPDEPVLRPYEIRRAQGRAVPAGLARLDSLPPVARGIVYAELLGKPIAFREPREGGGD